MAHLLLVALSICGSVSRLPAWSIALRALYLGACSITPEYNSKSFSVPPLSSKLTSVGRMLTYYLLLLLVWFDSSHLNASSLECYCQLSDGSPSYVAKYPLLQWHCMTRFWARSVCCHLVFWRLPIAFAPKVTHLSCNQSSCSKTDLSCTLSPPNSGRFDARLIYLWLSVFCRWQRHDWFVYRVHSPVVPLLNCPIIFAVFCS